MNIEVKFRRITVFLMGLGALLSATILFQMSVRISGPTPFTKPFVLGAALGLPFAVGLIAGGYWLNNDPFPKAYDGHIAVGTISGLVFFVVFIGIIAINFFNSLIKQAEIIIWGASVGAGGGFFISFLHIHSIDREVVAQRAQVLVEEAERRRELLEYLNGLLRHEVLNAVTAINGHADHANKAIDDEMVSDRLEVIQRQSDELTRVVDDVRLLLEASKRENDLKPINLTTILHDELRKLQDKHWTVETETDLPEEMWVEADNLIRRLFSNLLENAVKHNDSPTPWLSVTGTQFTDTVMIQIEDNGSGFPEQDLEEIIESVTNTETNHGLGLGIVNRLVDRYDGSIELTNTGPEGSLITITLPHTDRTSTVTDSG